MKTALILLLSLGAAGAIAQDNSGADRIAPEKPRQVKKLGSFTWDLNAHKLVWIVQTGSVVDGDFVASSEQRYEISPDQAVMAASGEMRGFDDSEAANLRKLLDVLAIYCAESVEWWDEGQGIPLDPHGFGTDPHTAPKNKVRPDQPGGQKPVRVGAPEDSEKPKYRIPEGDLVAVLMRAR